MRRTKVIPDLKKLKNDMLKALEENLEKHFFRSYPNYKNEYLSLSDIDKTDGDFVDFCVNANYIYNFAIKQIEKAENKKELDRIRIHENMFNEAPF